MTHIVKSHYFKPVPANVELVGQKVLDAAFKVHTVLGPGLLESVYEACMAYEIRKSGLKVETQVALPVLMKAFMWMLVYEWICSSKSA